MTRHPPVSLLRSAFDRVGPGADWAHIVPRGDPVSQPRQPKVPPQAAPEQPPVEEPQQPQPVDPATLPAAQTAAEQPPVEEPPQDPATLPPAGEEPAPLPQGHDDLVALAIDRGVPSYEAWNLTDADLRARLEQ